jgi:hypothetical protein
VIVAMGSAGNVDARWRGTLADVGRIAWGVSAEHAWQRDIEPWLESVDQIRRHG